MTHNSSAATGAFTLPSHQLDMFDAVTAVSTSTVGLFVVLPTPCSTCGSHQAVIGSSVGSHCARLLCAGCDRHRAWMSRETHGFINSIIDNFGKPTQPIIVTFKNSRDSANKSQ